MASVYGTQRMRNRMAGDRWERERLSNDCQLFTKLLFSLLPGMWIMCISSPPLKSGEVWWLNSVQCSKSQNEGAISRPKLIKHGCFPICRQGTDNNSATGSSRKLITVQGYCLGLLCECEINFFVLESVCVWGVYLCKCVKLAFWGISVINTMPKRGLP